MKRILCSGLILLAVSGVLFARGGSQSQGAVEVVDFQYWADEQKSGIDAMVDIFNKAHTDMRAEATLIPGRVQYFTRLTASIPAGTGPDVMVFNSSIVDYLDYLVPLDDKIPGSGIDMSKFPQMMVNHYSYNGKMYGIPKDVDTAGVYYNKAMFDRAGVPYPTAGWKWEDFRQAAIRLTRGDEFGFAADYLDAQVGYGNFVRQLRGGRINDRDVGPNVNDDSMVQAFEFLRQLMYVDKAAIDANAISETNASDLFMSEKVAMITHGSWMASVFYGGLGENLGIAELPREKFQGCQIGGLCYGLNNKSGDAAWEFMKFLASKEAQAATSKVVIPAYEGAAEEWIAAYPTLDLRVFTDAVNYGWTERGFIKNANRTSMYLTDAVALILADPTVNIKAELDKAQAGMVEAQR